jgi:hypothetical protein
MSPPHDRKNPKMSPHIEMTLKIETASDGEDAVLRLIGRVQSEYVDELQSRIRRHHARVVLDLDEVTLVDLAVVRFFIACEAEGIQLLRCSPYIREWMERERHRLT